MSYMRGGVDIEYGSADVEFPFVLAQIRAHTSQHRNPLLAPLQSLYSLTVSNKTEIWDPHRWTEDDHHMKSI